MSHYFTRIVGPAALLAASACSDFLTGEKLSNDPNQPQVASRFLLLNGVQAAQFTNQTGSAARTFGIWTQQFSGTSRQYSSLEQYVMTPDDYSSTFNSTYAGGGLVDIRKMQADARSANDRIFLGVAQVWEALTIGTATMLFGDIPYREAVRDEIATPRFDPQAQVYADLQILLDSAIVNLQSNQGSGPQAYDLVYGASRANPASVARWVAAARTLKARYYMHMAERDPSNYARAIGQANLGIMNPADDFRTRHSSTPGEENLWFQFMFRERDDYIRAGANLVNLLKSRGDPRETEFFAPAEGGTVVGAAPGSNNTAASVLSATRGSASFRQPLITAEENILLRAEARYQTGDQVGALADLNTVRAFHGLAPVAAAGTALLTAIAEEMYIALFQSVEVMSLYRRVCYPNLAPVDGGNIIPRRLFYSSTELNANPNAPDVENLFNPNDRAGGTLFPGAACLGQVEGAP